MEIQLRKREQVKLESLRFKETFKLIDNLEVLQVVDISGEAAFKDIIRTDAIYCANLSRGELMVLPKTLTVEKLELKVVEKQDEV